ncbi:hypothetical protein [Nicoliella lavandulae]|uniref:Uncharacterized protein n=1 Tax=Nicoliella lavandulae TaxID=3082954 RepID=A0ABU8SJ41_9LACO
MSDKKSEKKEPEEVARRLREIKKSAREDSITPADGWNDLLALSKMVDISQSKAADYRKTLVAELSRKDDRGFLIAGTGREIKAAVNDSKYYKDIDVDGLSDPDAYELDEKRNSYRPIGKDSVESVVDKVLK